MPKHNKDEEKKKIKKNTQQKMIFVPSVCFYAVYSVRSER